MGKWLRDWVLPIVGGTLIILVGLVVFAGVLITRNMCGDDVLSEEVSPDGRNVAVVMERSCGATTPYIYHVNLRSKAHRFSREWGGTVTEGQVFSVARVGVRAEWIGNDQLQIVCGQAREVRNRPASWQGIRILYSDGVSTVPANDGK